MVVSFHVAVIPSSFAPMTLHDSYARFTPYELAFPARDLLDELIVGIEEEAGRRGMDSSDLNAFFTMGRVDAFVREIQGPNALPETVHQYVALVFHAVHFTRAGCPIYLLSERIARHLVEDYWGGQPTPPEPSGYVQLPQHLFWMSSAGSDAPESIDGIFCVLSKRGMLHSLLITGLRPDRPGFATVPVQEAPVSEASSWVDAVVRDGTDDFSSQLPGGELDQLHSVETSGEVLKLLARFFAYISAVPDAIDTHHPSTNERVEPTPSALPFFRVTQDA